MSSAIIIIVSKDNDFINRIKSATTIPLVITQDGDYKRIDNHTNVAAILDLITIEPNEALLKRLKRDAVLNILVVNDSHSDLIEKFKDTADDIWVKSLHPLVLSKRLEMLGKILSAKEEKAKYVSHLNYSLNPLISQIKLYVYILNRIKDKESSTQKLKKYIKALANAQENISDTLRNFVEYVYIETGQFKIHPETVPFSGVVKGIKEAFENIRERSKSSCELELDIPENLPSIAVDIHCMNTIIYGIFKQMFYNSSNCYTKITAKTVGDFVVTGISIETYYSGDILSYFPYPLGHIIEHTIEMQGGEIWGEHDSNNNVSIYFSLPIAKNE